MIEEISEEHQKYLRDFHKKYIEFFINNKPPEDSLRINQMGLIVTNCILNLKLYNWSNDKISDFVVKCSKIAVLVKDENIKNEV